MLQIFMSQNQALLEVEEISNGSWIALTDPSEAELQRVEQEIGVLPDFLRAALDPEESPRIETEEGQTAIIVDAAIRSDLENQLYITIPIGIIMLKQHIVTVSLSGDTILESFKHGSVKEFYTQFKTRFVLQILFRNASHYLNTLKVLEKLTNRLEKTLNKSFRNKELLQMLQIEKSLVYISTSLRSNEMVLERMLRQDQIKNYPDDADLLDDVIIENKQAIEMCNVYVTILTSTMESYAHVIENNQNNVMKVLTSITLVSTIPSIIGAFWGMNVNVPLQDSPYAFAILIGATAVLMVILLIILRYIKML